MSKVIKIGIAGTRGIPANYGGFETFAQEISKRLANAGYEVSVYCQYENGSSPKTLGKVKLHYIPIKKSTNQPIYFFISLWKALNQNDLVIVTSTGASYFYFFNLLFFRKKIITNTDGLESRRSKWGILHQLYLKYSEYFAVKNSNAIVADAQGIANYLRSQYRKTAPLHIIEYGAEEVQEKSDAYKEYNVEAGNYLLIVARLEPENNILLMLDAYRQSGISMPLLVVGKQQDTQYVKLLQQYSSNNIRFLDGIYDACKLNSLRLHAFAYLHGHSVGGTNPSLLEAMASRSICICHDNIYNREVTDNQAYYFANKQQLASLLQNLWRLPAEELEAKKQFALDRIRHYYTWDKMLEKYEQLIATLVR